jgi:hypothetical protein
VFFFCRTWILMGGSMKCGLALSDVAGISRSGSNTASAPTARRPPSRPRCPPQSRPRVLDRLVSLRGSGPLFSLRTMDTYGVKPGDNGDNHSAISAWLELIIDSVNNITLLPICSDSDGT